MLFKKHFLQSYSGIRVSTTSIWEKYMWNKYYKKVYPVIAKNTGASHVWIKMINVREEVDHIIWWQIKAGNSSI